MPTNSESKAVADDLMTFLGNCDEHVLSLVARRLRTTDLAVMRAVSTAWKQFADNLEVRRVAFRSTWCLADLEGEPKDFNFYLAAGLGHFVVKYIRAAKSSLASVVVKFRTDTLSLRVLNNCTSDFSLQCRPYLYVPVPGRESLVGKRATFTFDTTCRRQLIVLSDISAIPAVGEGSLLPAEELAAGTMEALARTKAAAHRVAATSCNLDEITLDNNQREALLKKLSKQMGRGLNIDEGTASYYLDLARGDMKQAFEMYREDVEWESRNSVGVLPLRQRVPIPY